MKISESDQCDEINKKNGALERHLIINEL